MTKIFTFFGGDNQFDTVAKGQNVEGKLRSRGFGHIMQMARSMTPQDAARYHSEAYVNALMTGRPPHIASSSGLRWDVHYRNAIFGMAGAMMEAMQYSLITGKPSFALCAGAHHARPERGMGFCALNSVAMSALYAARSTGRQVYVLDVDAHAGGGTQAFIDKEYNEDIHHLDLITAPFDSYAPHRPQDAQITVDVYGMNPVNAYFTGLVELLSFADTMYPPNAGDILIVNAGCDVHEESAIGGWEGMDNAMIAAREATIRDWAVERGLIYTGLMAGGYSDEIFTPEMLAETHVRSICALLGL